MALLNSKHYRTATPGMLVMVAYCPHASASDCELIRVWPTPQGGGGG